MPTLVGVFEQPAKVAEAAKRLRDRGYAELQVYSPVPSHELDHVIDEKPSRVRVWTLVGGLLGVTAGYALTIWMSTNWKLVVGGKPWASIPPYTIIAFELTILLGGLATLLGLLVVGKLPRFRPDPAYHPRFSAEDFGLVVSCEERDVAEVDGLLRAHQAKEVNLVEG